MTLTYGEMFTGIGGMSLGLERAGLTPTWFAESDLFCSRVLANHWPTVPNLGDVTTIDWKRVPRVDLIAGGYPCQPFSLAGKRLGELDARHLWPRMLDAVRVLRPRFALLENVSGHLALGFGRVLGDLAEIGYDAEWDCIPAAAVGAPHRRDRVYVVAYPQREQGRSQPLCFGRRSREALARHHGPNGHVADADGPRLEVGKELDSQQATNPADRSAQGRHPDGCRHEVAHADVLKGRPLGAAEPEGGSRSLGGRSAQPGRRGGLVRGQWTAEPDVGRVAHGVPARVDRLRALGNAVVPQVAEHIGRLIVGAAA